MTKHNRNQSGLVYSTDPDLRLDDEPEVQETLPAGSQRLIVRLDTKQRKGKVVTIIEGFVGRTEDLEALGKVLKTKVGAGGSVKEGLILIQGDFKKMIINQLSLLGYQAK